MATISRFAPPVVSTNPMTATASGIPSARRAPSELSDAQNRRLAATILVITLSIYAGLAGVLSWQLRDGLRTQVLRREGEAIRSVLLLQQAASEARWRELGIQPEAIDFFDAVLESSRLGGVLAVGLFDADGQLQTALPISSAAPLAPEVWQEAVMGAPAVRFQSTTNLGEVLGIPAATQSSLLQVAVPLLSAGTSAPVGVTNYWIDGREVAAEFALLDRRLAWQTLGAIVGGGVLLAIPLMWAFSRLSRAHSRLAASREDLARANRELALSARTSAIGAISAHLIHGLKNPLAGLAGFVEGGSAEPSAPTEDDPARAEAWREAAATTRRLRSLVSEVTAVLRDESAAANFQVTAEEIAQAAAARVMSLADQRRVDVLVQVECEAVVDGRIANLGGLVLHNLLSNAIEASPLRAAVYLTVRSTHTDLTFAVEDRGEGLPPEVREHLFQPVQSNKAGGGGIGLALSQQLARHAGGRLELTASDAEGTVFVLRFPLAPSETARLELAGAVE